MKKSIMISFLLVSFVNTFAQSGSAKQVNWVFLAKKISGNVYEVRCSATIKGDFHLYAQVPGVEGPVPTTFSFSPNPLLSLTGKVKEQGKLVKKFESAWDGTVNFYEKKVDFIQVIKIKGKVKTNLIGEVEFMVCNDAQCLPPAKVPFKVALGN
jgi:thiol:disulfide interchange protein DsbD